MQCRGRKCPKMLADQARSAPKSTRASQPTHHSPTPSSPSTRPRHAAKNLRRHAVRRGHPPPPRPRSHSRSGSAKEENRDAGSEPPSACPAMAGGCACRPGWATGFRWARRRACGSGFPPPCAGLRLHHHGAPPQGFLRSCTGTGFCCCFLVRMYGNLIHSIRTPLISRTLPISWVLFYRMTS